MLVRLAKPWLLILFLAFGLSCIIPIPQPQEAPPAPEEPAPAPEEEEAPILEAPQPGVVLPAPARHLTLNFQGAYLVHETQSGIIQITAEGMVLSYGRDWEIRKVKPFIFHLRYRAWQGFFWKVNTSGREVFRVKNGTFGSAIGGSDARLPFKVEVVKEAANAAVKRFIITFPKSHMAYTPGGDVLRLTTEGYLLSNCEDWRRCKVHSNLFHFKQKEWDNFFWKVNTASKKVWRLRNGVICERRPGGSEDLLDIKVGVTR
ncbi:MAG TPA: hypothetical protein VGB72_09925 [Acidobacteriota bacterium]